MLEAQEDGATLRNYSTPPVFRGQHLVHHLLLTAILVPIYAHVPLKLPRQLNRLPHAAMKRSKQHQPDRLPGPPGSYAISSGLQREGVLHVQGLVLQPSEQFCRVRYRRGTHGSVRAAAGWVAANHHVSSRRHFEGWQQLRRSGICR